MTDTATRTDGLPERYYAPEFRLEIEGQELDPASKADVLEIKVEMSIDELTSVDVKLNNYDDTTFDLKWSDSPRFQIGNLAHLQLGYAERLVSMLRGPITALTPEFLSDGPPTLGVRFMDSLVRLKGSKPPEDEVMYRDLADWQIAQRIAQRHQLSIVVTEEGPVHDVVVQRNSDDVAFLKERAARIDFDVFMQTDAISGTDELHFVRPADGRGAEGMRTYRLAWGTLRNTDVLPSMIEFRPIITVSDQVQSVTVRGWDPSTKQAIVYTASPDDTDGVAGSGDATGPATAGRLAGPGSGRQEAVVDAPVASEAEARELAEALLAERAYEFLTGTGKTIGLPDLRPGQNVEIDGVGLRFGGTYFVTKVLHTLDANGFLTQFDARKTFEGSGSGADGAVA